MMQHEAFIIVLIVSGILSNLNICKVKNIPIFIHTLYSETYFD